MLWASLKVRTAPAILLHALINLLAKLFDLLDVFPANGAGHVAMVHVGNVFVKATHSDRQVNVVLRNVSAFEFLAAGQHFFLEKKGLSFGMTLHQQESWIIAHILRLKETC